MGESITEGEIAELLKAVGDAVEEDETIAQIETDKVTIDVKAPSAGKLAELRVEQGETVKVGQVVAIIAEGEAGDSSPAEEQQPAEAKTEPAKEEPAEEPKSKSEPKREAQASPEAEEAKDPVGRKPMIRFPPRMTDNGQRISDLPLGERQKWLKQASEAEPTSTAAEPAPKKETEARPQRGPWYAGKEQGTKLSSSQVLSDREMEMIELGGAPP